MQLFLDSSALAKRYILETGSRRVLQYCQDASEISLSVLCLTELISAFNRLRREKKLTASDYQALKRELAADIRQATIIDMTPDIIQRSILCLENNQLRALDAIHIASAANAGCDLFLSADRQQTKAAKKEGLSVALV